MSAYLFGSTEWLVPFHLNMQVARFPRANPPPSHKVFKELDKTIVF